MTRVLIVFATRGGQTRQIAEIIAEGVRLAGGEAVVKAVTDIQSEADLQGFDAYALGSPTYHGDMLQAMKTMLFLAEKAGLAGKVGGSFGAYGWSGEALQRIYDTMQHIFGMNMVGDPLSLKALGLEGGLQMAQSYGRLLVEKAAGD
jgi:flavorubredoxin